MSSLSINYVILYIVDARHAAQFTHQDLLNALLEAFAREEAADIAMAHVLLLGFDQNDLIVLHRQLFDAGIAPARCHALLSDQEQVLSAVSGTLVDIVIQHMVNALSPSIIINVANGEALERPGPTLPAENADKPSLAFVSPLPPQATGIASYSAELLPYLAAHFTLTLVVDQPQVDPELSQGFECIDADTFSQRACEFDYTLYQVDLATVFRTPF